MDFHAELLAFVRAMAERDGLHVIRLNGQGTHADDCPPCWARAILQRRDAAAQSRV